MLLLKQSTATLSSFSKFQACRRQCDARRPMANLISKDSERIVGGNRLPGRSMAGALWDFPEAPQ